MKSIIHEIYHGNISPQDNGVFSTAEYKASLRLVAEQSKTLEAGLSEAQLAEYEKLRELQCDLASLGERECFSWGFRVGAQLMNEILLDK